MSLPDGKRFFQLLVHLGSALWYIYHTSLPVVAQAPDFSFDHLTGELGLSQSTVYAITQDTEGYMWFGTRDGLNRYDARKVAVYKHSSTDRKSLSANTVNALFTDSKGMLWVGTNNGLNRYHPEQDNFSNYHSIAGNRNTLPHNNITAIAEDNQQNVWVGTNRGLCLLLSHNPVKFQQFQHSPTDSNSLIHDQVRSLFQDANGTLWIGTARGISKMVYTSTGAYQFYNYPLNPSDQHNWVNSIGEAQEGKLWIGTEKTGLWVMDTQTGRLTPWHLPQFPELRTETIRTIAKDKKGDIWVGTVAGLYIINPSRNTFIELKNNPEHAASLSDNSIRSFYLDNQGTYWIGTFYGGVNTYSPLAKQFGQVRLPDGRAHHPSFKIASSITTDSQQNLWVSTDGNGLYFIDHAHNTFQHFKHRPGDSRSLSNNKIKCLLLEENQGLWIGTFNGLNYYDFRKKEFTHYFHQPNNPNSLPDDRVYDLKKDSEGNLWIATYRGGLCRFNPVSQAFENFTHQSQKNTTLSTNGITFIHEDGKKRLWLGTVTGLNLKLPKQNTFRRFLNNPNDSLSISGDYILCIYEDSRQNLWIGTRDSGLSLMLPGGKGFRQFTVKHGLPGNNIYGIQEDGNGFLWMSTENGLSRLDPHRFVFKNYDANDGLICREFNFNSFHKDRQGYLYFGGYNGIVAFHPDSIHENTVVPRLTFTNLRVLNREVAIQPEGSLLPQSIGRTHSLTFDHTHNIFSIEFAVLNYVNANKNRYAYKLEGFEEQWNYVKEPVATYMNLHPGKYTLLVKGANNNEIWNQEPLRMQITVLPPPWKSWWAYTIYAFLVGGLFYTWARFNRKQLKLAHELQLEHLEKEQEKELHETKLNFFTNVAHEIRTPLTLITGPVDQLVEKYPEDAFLQKHLKLVKVNTNRLLRLLNQLLDFQKHDTGKVRLKLKEGDLGLFLKEIVASMEAYAYSRHIRLVFQSECPEVKACYDPEELEKVFYNLLTNAFKYSPAGGQVTIRLAGEDKPEVKQSEMAIGPKSITGKYIKITIEDNGIGIPPKDLPHIFHRYYQAENLSIHDTGFGIGLALAKGIIDLHGGTIEVDSQEASAGALGYTRFTIELPILAPALADAEEMGRDSHAELIEQLAVEYSHEEIEPVAVPSALPPEKPAILIVEDNADIRNYLQNLLMAEYEVWQAAHGQEALEIATRQLPNLVISDIAMPVMNGIELSRKLKTDSRTHHIPIILLTARGAISQQAEGLGTGADDYITKPFHVSVLLLKIKNLLSLRQQLKEKYHRIVTLQPQPPEVDDPDSQFLHRLLVILEANLADAEFNVSKLVSEIGMSRPVLFRKIKMLTGLSVIDLIRNTRMKKAEMLLKEKKLTVSEVAFLVGFNDPKYFSKTFRNQFGKTPTEYVDQLP